MENRRGITALQSNAGIQGVTFHQRVVDLHRRLAQGSDFPPCRRVWSPWQAWYCMDCSSSAAYCFTAQRSSDMCAFCSLAWRTCRLKPCQSSDKGGTPQVQGGETKHPRPQLHPGHSRRWRTPDLALTRASLRLVAYIPNPRAPGTLQEGIRLASELKERSPAGSKLPMSSRHGLRFCKVPAKAAADGICYTVTHPRWKAHACRNTGPDKAQGSAQVQCFCISARRPRILAQGSSLCRRLHYDTTNAEDKVLPIFVHLTASLTCRVSATSDGTAKHKWNAGGSTLSRGVDHLSPGPSVYGGARVLTCCLSARTYDAFRELFRITSVDLVSF